MTLLLKTHPVLVAIRAAADRWLRHTRTATSTGRATERRRTWERLHTTGERGWLPARQTRSWGPLTRLRIGAPPRRIAPASRDSFESAKLTTGEFNEP